MFTGIIEAFGTVKSLEKESTNLHITLESDLAKTLKIDQSVAHNGVCLTVIACDQKTYRVTAIEETLLKSNIGTLQINDLINLERAMKLGDRLDGHMVQGHVDQIATCIQVQNNKGSWLYTFSYNSKKGNITIEKGSITVNGVSLTVVDSQKDHFSVAIIPYTYENTNFHTFAPDKIVNLEFDLIGKYIAKLNSIS